MDHPGLGVDGPFQIIDEAEPRGDGFESEVTGGSLDLGHSIFLQGGEADSGEAGVGIVRYGPGEGIDAMAWRIRLAGNGIGRIGDWRELAMGDAEGGSFAAGEPFPEHEG